MGIQSSRTHEEASTIDDEIELDSQHCLHTNRETGEFAGIAQALHSN
jgi:hypothetical protein